MTFFDLGMVELAMNNVDYFCMNYTERCTSEAPVDGVWREKSFYLPQIQISKSEYVSLVLKLPAYPYMAVNKSFASDIYRSS